MIKRSSGKFKSPNDAPEKFQEFITRKKYNEMFQYQEVIEYCKTSKANANRLLSKQVDKGDLFMRGKIGEFTYYRPNPRVFDVWNNFLYGRMI